VLYSILTLLVHSILINTNIYPMKYDGIGSAAYSQEGDSFTFDEKFFDKESLLNSHTDFLTNADHNPEQILTIENMHESSPNNVNVMIQSMQTIASKVGYEFIKENTASNNRVKKRRISDQFSCPSCDETFTQQVNLQQHILSLHTQESLFVCSYCRKGFARRDHLDFHIKVHTKEKPHACTLEGCDRKFANASGLKKHIRTMHAIATTVSHSIITEKTTPHQKTHIQEKSYRFVCNFADCGRIFSTQSYLDRHSDTHANKDFYTCTIEGCYRIFTLQSGLDNHIKKMHNQDTLNYKCDVLGCNKFFANTDDLLIHKHMHTMLYLPHCSYYQNRNIYSNLTNNSMQPSYPIYYPYSFYTSFPLITLDAKSSNNTNKYS
jgi:uncharacterized Zn-finger protein